MYVSSHKVNRFIPGHFLFPITFFHYFLHLDQHISVVYALGVPRLVTSFCHALWQWISAKRGSIFPQAARANFRGKDSRISAKRWSKFP